MYYEEKIINNILCYRTAPDGEWHEVSKEKLTSDYIERGKTISRLQREIEKKEIDLKKIKNIVKLSDFSDTGYDWPGKGFPGPEYQTEGWR